MRMDRVFSVLAVFALVSCDCVSAVFRAITQDSPVLLEVRETATFTYHTSTPYALMEVRLIRIQGGRHSIINIFRDGRDQRRCDLPEYIGRTELVKEDLNRGRASLKLFNVSISDEGTYRAYLETVDYFDFCDLELKVTALGSHPKIDIEGFQDGGIKAVCQSAGWYPEPMLVNKEDDGNMEIQQEENGFYTIKYSHVITENSKRPFSCRIRTLFPNQEQEASVYVADAMFRKCTDTIALIVLSAIAFLHAATAAGIFCLWTRHRNKQGPSSALYTGPCYLKVPLDQGLSCVNEQSPMCAVKNNEGSEPVLQPQDTTEQLQGSAMKNATK